VLALFDEALAALRTHESALGVRLLARLAVMSLWTASTERCDDLARRAVDAARRVGDPVTLCYALYGRHWAALGPAADLVHQLAGTDEMLALAGVARRRDLELTAHSLRFLVLLEIGRVAEAELELDAYDELVARVRVPRYRWRAGFYRTTLAFLRGRFGEIQERILRTLAEEERFRPADFSVGQTQLFWLLREHDRAAEIEPTLRTLPARFPSLAAAWRAALALLLAETGRTSEARELIDALARDDFRSLSRNFLWLAALALLGEACAVVGDGPRAARLYELLAPLRPRTIVLSAGAFCFGSLDLALGRLAAAAGHPDVALGHLAAALESNTAMGAHPWVGWTSLELARLLAARNTPEARHHLERARETATTLGMVRLERCCAEAARPLA
jgi:tetratricopeptide (TPR) repeat protein